MLLREKKIIFYFLKNFFFSDSVSEIHEKYQMEIELLKTEQANYIQEITREFEQKLSINEREVITRQNIEIGLFIVNYHYYYYYCYYYHYYYY